MDHDWAVHCTITNYYFTAYLSLKRVHSFYCLAQTRQIAGRQTELCSLMVSELPSDRPCCALLSSIWTPLYKCYTTFRPVMATFNFSRFDKWSHYFFLSAANGRENLCIPVIDGPHKVQPSIHKQTLKVLF